MIVATILCRTLYPLTKRGSLFITFFSYMTMGKYHGWENTMGGVPFGSQVDTG